MSEWVYTAINAAFTLVCCWQASKATDARAAARLNCDSTQRYFEWARNEADRATKSRMG